MTAGGDSTGDETGRETARTGWPVRFRGVTESVTATLGPNDRWNLAALGLYAPGRSPAGGDSMDGGSAAGQTPDLTAGVTARTWGRTRTRRNFTERGAGYVQFVRDPVAFVDAALGIVERDEPVHEAADAWARVEAERLAAGEGRGTEWVDWRLRPVRSGVERRGVATINRGFGAVIEATVVASRLDVEAFDTEAGLRRLSWLAGIVETCGGVRERRAFERIDEHVGWRSMVE